jgi:hypothetical protein
MAPLDESEALFARMMQHFAERRRYQLSQARTLAGFRKFARVSQEELAQRLGWKQSRVSKFERHADPRLGALVTYVAALGGTLALLARLPGRDVQLEVPSAKAGEGGAEQSRAGQHHVDGDPPEHG